MANETEVGLIWRLRTQGTQQVQADLRRLTGNVQQTRAAAERSPKMSGWRTSFASIQTAATGLLGTLSRLAGFAGLGVGLFGLEAVRRDFIALDNVLLEIQNSQNLTDDQAAALGRRFHEMGYEAGRSAAEVAALADQMADLGSNWDRALEAAPKLSLYARSINLDDVAAVADAFAGLEKITGGTIPLERQLAMLREMQRATPVSEATFMSAAARAAGPAATIGQLRGEEGVRALGGILAVLGKTYAQQPRKIQGGLEQLIDTFQDPELRQSIKALGVDVTNVGTMFDGLLRVLQRSPSALDGIQGLSDEFRVIMQGAVANATVFRNTQQQISGNVRALGADLERAGRSSAVSFGRAVEGLKIALEPIVSRLARWVGENQDKIAALGNMLARLGTFAAEHGEAIIAFFIALRMQARMGAAVAAGVPGAAAGQAILGTAGASWVAAKAAAPMNRSRSPMPPSQQAAAARPLGGALGGAAASVVAGMVPTALILGTMERAEKLVDALLEWKAPESNLSDLLELRRQKNIERGYGEGPVVGFLAAVSRAQQMAGAAVEMSEGIRRAIEDGLAQARIEVQLHASMSPDGITTTATQRQRGRTAQAPIVRADLVGSWTG